MDAPHPSAPAGQVTEISVARLGTAIFSVLALMFSFGALIVASNHRGSGTSQQATQATNEPQTAGAGQSRK